MIANPYMQRALELAKQAAALGEVPVGAVIVENASSTILGEGFNRVEATGNPLWHAEIVAMEAAIAKGSSGERLRGCDLYVTLEPCPMCAAALSLARIDRIYFAAYDPKGGGICHGPKIFESSSCHHQPEVYSGIGEEAAAALLRGFFSRLR